MAQADFVVVLKRKNINYFAETEWFSKKYSYEI